MRCPNPATQTTFARVRAWTTRSRACRRSSGGNSTPWACAQKHTAPHPVHASRERECRHGPLPPSAAVAPSNHSLLTLPKGAQPELTARFRALLFRYQIASKSGTK